MGTASAGLAIALTALLTLPVWLFHRRRRATVQAVGAVDQGTPQPPAPAGLFETLFEAAPDCIKLHDADGIVQRINPAGLALLDTTDPARIVAQPVYIVIAAEYHTAYRTMTAAVFAGESRSMTFELTTFNGRRRWLETHAVPMRDGDGRVTSLVAVTRDIDETRRLTRQLVDQRNHLHTIIESEPECVKLQDRDGVIVEMNPAGLALLRADSPHQVIGRTVYDFLEADYVDAYRALTEAVFRGERRSMEFEVTTIPGQRRWLETHAAPLRDASGHVTALLAITRDIDGRKRDEERLRLQQDELAHVCRLSTLGELASGIAHELNQPLCALSSYAETAATVIDVADSPVDPTLSPLLYKIVAEAERASGIIHRLREFVRRQTPHPQPNRVSSLISDTLRLVEAELRRRRILVVVSIDDDLPEVNVDRVQAEQILLNLLHNAIQALTGLEPERRRIRFTAGCTDDQVTIRLRDYAGGIPAAQRNQLFTPFFTTKPEGIGMGLALSRNIAEAFGGQLRYRPADPGSTFELTLPVAGT